MSGKRTSRPSATSRRPDPVRAKRKDMAAATRVVGILGGMGPAAGAHFGPLFVPARPQPRRARGQPGGGPPFPDHGPARVPVPDRTGAVVSDVGGAPQPLEPMLQALGRLAALGSRAVAIACNTAHAWHGNLQERFPQVELL